MALAHSNICVKSHNMCFFCRAKIIHRQSFMFIHLAIMVWMVKASLKAGKKTFITGMHKLSYAYNLVQ